MYLYQILDWHLLISNYYSKYSTNPEFWQYDYNQVCAFERCHILYPYSH